MSQVIVGGESIVFALLVALYARGHVLIEGVPGTGKTLAVRAFALLFDLEFRRIAFTPDLMPSDVIGTTVFNPQTTAFTTRLGPIHTSVLLADEINRTPPKTQSALLEAMEEGRVTIDGAPFDLPRPFIVCATQNPIEYEGTYPLPEAQLDRFLLKAETGYPDAEQERDLLARTAAGFDARALERSGVRAIASAGDVLAAQDEIRRVHVAPGVMGYVYDIVAATRENAHLTLGASPRAGVALLLASQAAAAIAGRPYVMPDDVKEVAPAVLGHRLLVAPQAEIEGVRARDVLSEVLHAVAVPRDVAPV